MADLRWPRLDSAEISANARVDAMLSSSDVAEAESTWVARESQMSDMLQEALIK